MYILLNTLLSLWYISIPTKINWEENIPRDTTEWEWQVAVCKLFEEQPIWPRRSLHEHLLDDGMQVSENQLKRLLFRAGYYFSTGPFGRFWIRKGYDPRKDPDSRIFQKVDFRVPPQLRNLGDLTIKTESKQRWKDICQFQVIPSKSFVCLQLFEVVDDFIQEEIRKPSKQRNCLHSTGWFSRSAIKTLRLHVAVRFLSLYPIGSAKDLLRSAKVLLERSKKEAAVSKFQKLEEEEQQIISDSSCFAEASSAEPEEHEHEDQNGIINGETEEEEDEEEEEEADGYDSPDMAQKDGGFSIDGNSYNVGESIPNDYLQELLRGFPLDREGKNSQFTHLFNGADASDDEYKIYEQDSDDSETLL
uniref:Transcription factor IIIC subunit 5 HTH domain-containing protein n=1 Tax=Ananas comosus var. bracteatus TaxID=296719 RepID=A0A6V7PAI5_ANACO|nr:unnamed protein product [Ananas comosus var. bracteatus]